MKGDVKDQSETIVIADECGDSMWDEVLQQEAKKCDIKNTTPTVATLINYFNNKNKS